MSRNPSPVPSVDFSSLRSSSRGVVSGWLEARALPHLSLPATDLVYPTRLQVSSQGLKAPPSVNALYTAIDTGCASPRHMRSTTTILPTSAELTNRLGLPLALVTTPFALPQNGEEEIPVVDYSASGQGPVRCRRCKAYISPNCNFQEKGHSWLCGLCKHSNKIPDWSGC
jgi:hypothetical protein